MGKGSGPKPLYKSPKLGSMEDQLYGMAQGAIQRQYGSPSVTGTTGMYKTPQSKPSRGPYSAADSSANQTMGQVYRTMNPRQYVQPGQQQQEIQDFSNMGPRLPQTDWGRLSNSLNAGTLLSGQKVPMWDPGSAYKFTGMNVPGEAFDAAQRAQEGAVRRAMLGSMNQINDQMAARGVGQAGLQEMANTSLGRQAMQDIGTSQAQFGLQKAMQELEMSKWLQAAQADEDFRRSQLGLSGQQALHNQLLQDIGAMGTISAAQAQEEMAPYMMLQDLYKTGLNVPMQPGSSKGSPLSALLSAGGTIAGTMLGGPGLGTAIGSAAGSIAGSGADALFA